MEGISVSSCGVSMELSKEPSFIAVEARSGFCLFLVFPCKAEVTQLPPPVSIKVFREGR